MLVYRRADGMRNFHRSMTEHVTSVWNSGFICLMSTIRFKVEVCVPAHTPHHVRVMVKQVGATGSFEEGGRDCEGV